MGVSPTVSLPSPGFGQPYCLPVSPAIAIAGTGVGCGLQASAELSPATSTHLGKRSVARTRVLAGGWS